MDYVDRIVERHLKMMIREMLMSFGVKMEDIDLFNDDCVDEVSRFKRFVASYIKEALSCRDIDCMRDYLYRLIDFLDGESRVV